MLITIVVVDRVGLMRNLLLLMLFGILVVKDNTVFAALKTKV